MKLKSFVATRSVGFYIILGAVITQIVAIILYANTGVSEFSPELSALPFVMGGLAACCGIASLFFEQKLIREIAYLFSLFAFISYVGTQTNYLGNIFTAIDGSTFSAGFIFTVIFFLVSFIAMFVSGFFTRKYEEDNVNVVVSEAKED